MYDDHLSNEALRRAFGALNSAAADLTVATALAPPRSALANDAGLLAEAVECEPAAVLATIERRFP